MRRPALESAVLLHTSSSTVTEVGLVAKPQHNGKRGVVLRRQPQSERWQVRLDDGTEMALRELHEQGEQDGQDEQDELGGSEYDAADAVLDERRYPPDSKAVW